MSGLRRWGRAVAGLAIAALFAVLLARRVDRQQMSMVLGGASWPALVLAVLALTADMGARITRWWWMLRPVQPALTWGSCARPFLASLALNNTVPLRAGDVVRIFGFQRTLRAPAAHIAGTLLLERMLDLLVLLTVLFVSVLRTSGVFPRAFLLLAYGAGALCLVALVAITLVPDRLTSIAQAVAGRFLPDQWVSKSGPILAQLTASLSLLRSLRRAVSLLGISVVAWILEGAVFASALWSLHISVPWQAAWLALAAATLATLLPSSPGYVGTFDYFASLGLTAYGAGRSAAAAFAVLAHVIIWLPVTVAGFAVLLWSRRPVAAGVGRTAKTSGATS
ncbi:MAG: lysylphosphatidylglycerol synthase transmembrane domain-containing protein [Gemmatimonadales bacterium]